MAKSGFESGQVAAIQNDIGFLYMEQEDYEQAKVQFNKSLQVYVSQKNLREEARLMLNLGVVEQRRANYGEALDDFRIGLKIAEEASAIDIQIADNEGIGVVLTATNDFSGANEFLNKSLALAKKENNAPRQTEILWRLAQLNLERGDYAQSSKFAESAVEQARYGHQPKLLYLALTTLGQSYSGLGKFDLAITVLKEAVDKIERTRNQIAGRVEEVQLFFENKVSAYNSLVDLLTQRGNTFEALAYAERSKGRVLLGILEGAKTDIESVMSSAEKNTNLGLNRKISEINDRVRRETKSTGLDSLEKQLDSARLEYDSFEDAIYSSHPELSIRNGHTSALTAANVAGLAANKDCVYLEYVVGKERVYLFVLGWNSSDGAPELSVYPLEIKPEELAKKVDNFHGMLADRHLGYAAAAHELYSVLIKPAERQLSGTKTLCIIPDGQLWNTPFQALISDGNRFLIEDHAIYYAPSLSVLRQMTVARLEQPTANSSFFAMGDPYIDPAARRGDELCPLPEAATEVTETAKLFGPKQTGVLTGHEATEKVFKEAAPGFTTLHLATHGILDNRHPLFSYLMLSKADGDADNDGLLEAREIMWMHLKADLAVLSACETADGRISPGEGVISMSWAFFVAGCQNTVASQWKINSASTSQLMQRFYRALGSSPPGSGSDKAGALREAMLQLIKDDSYRHPFYWAGFVLIGTSR